MRILIKTALIVALTVSTPTAVAVASGYNVGDLDTDSGGLSATIDWWAQIFRPWF